MKNSIKTGRQLPPYPILPAQPVREDYFGTSTTDEYRNLEKLEDPTVQAWLKQQSDYTNAVLNKIPRRQYLLDKQWEFDKRQSHSITLWPTTKNKQYFYLKKMGGENFAKLYYRKDLSSKEELLYDPAAYKPDSGFNYIINHIEPDWNGEKIVISLTKNGEEISELLIMDVATKTLLPDLITNNKAGGVSWLPDNSGFLYMYYPVIDIRSEEFLKNRKSIYYKLGQNTHQLNEVFSATKKRELNIQPEDYPFAYVKNHDSKYVFGEAGGIGRRDTYYAKMVNPSLHNFDWQLLFSKDEKVYDYIIKDEELIFLSGKNAPNFQICKTSLTHPDFIQPMVLVPEKKAEIIKKVVITIDGLFYVTTKNGVEAKLYHFKDGIETEIEVPDRSGSIFLKSNGDKYADLWVSTMGWLNSRRRYTYDFENKHFEAIDLVPVTQFPEYEDLIAKVVLVKSHDGVEVPLSIIHKKDLEMNGQNPVVIHGYGAYGLSRIPYFYPNFLLFTEEGGIFAVAHVRGGGEKGAEWHNGGKKTTKPNSWKDLIACTEYLIEKKYTSNQHTAIWSGSAGGILVGRAMTERPDLFAVVISKVGVMNPIRFEHTPNGPYNIAEFGTVKDPEECQALIEMDPYLHIEKGVNYPATLLTAGMNDPRVTVWQPAKFAAKLQAYQQSNKPILFSVDYEAGHGNEDAARKHYEFLANIYAFIFWQIGHSAYQLE